MNKLVLLIALSEAAIVTLDAAVIDNVEVAASNLTASGQAVNAKFFDFRVGRPMRGRALAGDSAVLAVA